MKLVLLGASMFAALVAGGASAAPAHRAAKPDCYATAMTQPAINACAAADAAEADRKLNRSYQALLCYLDDDQKARLKVVQRAWIAFRDADCAYWSSGGGSMMPMNEYQCIADLSTQRAKELDLLPPNADRGAFVSNCK